MVNDTEPRYRLVDSNGNVVGSLFAEADGTLALQEGTSGSDNEITVATDGTFNAPAVSTESSQIGTVSGEGDVSRLIERQTPDGLTQVQFSGLNSNTDYKIWMTGILDDNGGTAGNLGVRLNGDGGSTGNYEYFDLAGTRQTGANEFVLIDHSSFVGFAGWVSVTEQLFGSGGRPAISSDFAAGRLGRVNSQGDRGGRNVFEPISSIEIITTDNTTIDEAVVELWERDYS